MTNLIVGGEYILLVSAQTLKDVPLENQEEVLLVQLFHGITAHRKQGTSTIQMDIVGTFLDQS